MNLNNQEKKLFFSISAVLATIFIVGMLYWGVSSINSHWRNKNLQEKKAVIELYELKIDSIENKNIKLISEIELLDRKVDSLTKVKEKIYWNYVKEAKIIYDADAVNHAQWMDTIVRELKSNRK